MFMSKSLTPHNRETNKKLVKIIHALLESEESIPFRKPVPHKGASLLIQLWVWATTRRS